MVSCLGAAAFAGEAPDEEEPSAIEEIIVVGHPLSGEGLAQASDVLAGEELDRKAATASARRSATNRESTTAPSAPPLAGR